MFHKFHAPACIRCDDHFTYPNTVPQKRNGVSMHFGEEFCLGFKRARRFRKKDPKSKAPDWCPKYISPSVVRVYGFKDTENWLMHEVMCRELGKEIDPIPFRYRLEQTSEIQMHATEFHRRLMVDDGIDELLHMPVALHYVVEIFDGLQSACYYKTSDGFRYTPYFNTERILLDDAMEGGAAA